MSLRFGSSLSEPSAIGQTTFGKRVSNQPLSDRLRGFERVKVDVRAIVYSAGSSQMTMIRDISRGGAGIKGAVGLYHGAEVVLALVTGEKCTGTVRWWIGGACGIQFTDLLEPSDPFLCAIEKRSTVCARLRPGMG
ncbi:MAG: PilZ domain-containing protein [Proteobacteria bacterium]|nr:PilZ domain-containing protein [Pseudomonadota bacterium]